MSSKKLAMFSKYVTILQKGSDITPTNEVTGHRDVWPIGCDGALLLEQVFGCLKGIEEN